MKPLKVLSLSTHRYHERDEREELQRAYEVEESQCMAIELERECLAHCLNQLQKEFDDFYQVAVIPPPKTQSLELILQDTQLAP